MSQRFNPFRDLERDRSRYRVTLGTRTKRSLTRKARSPFR